MGPVRRQPWMAVLGALVVALLGLELVVGAAAHDPVEHHHEDAHGCFVCTFAHAQEVPEPVLADVVAPETGRTPAPVEAPRVHRSAVVASHLARGPPAPVA